MRFLTLVEIGKRLIAAQFAVIAAILFTTAALVFPGHAIVYAQTPEQAQPEDYVRPDKKYNIAPAKTIFIRERNPDEAASMLSDSHIAEAKKGWRVFEVNAYQKDGDFRGFFVTYMKVGETE